MLNRKIQLHNIIKYIIILVLLFDTTTMWKYVTTSLLYGKSFGTTIGLLVLFDIIVSWRLKIDKRTVKRMIIIILILGIYAALSLYNIPKYLSGFLGVFIYFYIYSFFLYKNNKMADFLNAFSNVMIIISIVSLFFWLFGSVWNILPGRTQLTYEWAKSFRTTYSYFNLYFENPLQNKAHGALCNLGVFTESPGYSGYLIYGFLIDLAKRMRLSVNAKKERRTSDIRLMIYMITLITSFSSKGIIAVLIIVFIQYISKQTKGKKEFAIRLIIGVIILIGASLASTYLLEDKLSKTSGSIRMDHLQASIKAFVHNPLIGVGYKNSNEIIKYTALKQSQTGLSMGLTVLLAYGGIYLFAFYCGAAVRAYYFEYFRKNKKTYALILSVLIFNLFVSNSAYDNAYLFMISAAYALPVCNNGRLTKRIC